MTALKIDNFGGVIPRISDKLLPNNLATESTDVKLFSGELRGWPLLDIGTPAHDFADGLAYKFVAKLKNNAGSVTFFGSLVEEASIVPDPAIDEAFDRYYLFEPDTEVKVATWAQIDAGQNPDILALPFPGDAPTLAPTSGAPDGSTPAEDRVYVYTWQTSWGEETEPSPTATVQVAADDSVDISDIEQPAAIPGRTWDNILIYRSLAGSLSTAFFYVTTLDISGAPDTDHVDTLPSAYLAYNRVLDAFSNEAPPDGLTGARIHPSGSIAAFLGRKVWFSRTYLPHAWPAQYAIAVDDDIVGIEIYGQNIAVMTETFIYLIYGQTPGQFALRKFPFASPGLSYRSIAPTESGVHFCSVRGLVFVDDSGPRLVTAAVIDTSEWVQEFFDGDVVAVMYGQIYMAWDRTNGGFMLDLREARTFVTEWTSTTGVTALNNDWYTGDILVTLDDKVYQWDDAGTAARTFVWSSKVFEQAKPLNFGALQVNGADGDSAQVKIYADGDLKFDQSVDFNAMRRLPSGFKATDWRVEVSGADPIQNIKIAETGKELASI
jgi:hypothetical protein